MLTFGELFAGIGGFSLGLERAGMTCKWQVEIDPYAQAVLRKHWPDVPKHDDVRTFPPPEGEWGVDLLCGGFPCQDISVAGKGAGLAGERSGLWSEFARIIRVLRPRWVVIENVPALTARGLGTVLGDLAEVGFDAEWHCIPASAVGAPHRRDRIWIVAHANDQGQSDVPVDDVSRRGLPELAGGDESADAIGQSDAMRRNSPPCSEGVACGASDVGGGQRDCGPGRAGQAGQSSGDVAYAESVRHPRRADAGRVRAKGEPQRHLRGESGRRSKALPDSLRDRLENVGEGRATTRATNRSSDGNGSGWWATEPDVGRVAHGIPSRVDRLRCLGNAVVPQVVEIIGRAIIQAEERLNTGAAVESLQRKDAR